MTIVDHRKRRDLQLMAVFVLLLLGCILPAKLTGGDDSHAPAKTSADTTPTETATTDATATTRADPSPAEPATAKPSTTTKPTAQPSRKPDPEPAGDEDEAEEDEPDESVYYANCTAARRAGAAPLHAGEPGYRRGLDRDGDGIACDS